MAKCDCCGCAFVDDYGTSTVSGSGTNADPYMLIRVDPAFVRPLVRVTGGTIASLVSGTPTLVTYNTEVFDTNNMWVIGTPGRITFQTRGFFIFGSKVVWPSNVTGQRAHEWRYTPASGAGTTVMVSTSNNAPSGDYEQQLNYQWYFEIGDYIEVYATQSSGGLLNLTSSIAWACYIGRKV